MTKIKRPWRFVLSLALLPWLIGASLQMLEYDTYSNVAARTQPNEVSSQSGLIPGPPHRIVDGMVWNAGGIFQMGCERPAPDDQQPVHCVRLDPFWIDQTLVTNRQFSRFINATGHITTADQRGTSLVFDTNLGHWRDVAGANWQHPRDHEDSIAGRDHYPVVHVSWFDATAYAAWAGKRLLTEAEYECAARGGLVDRPYPWGRNLVPTHGYQANFWQGWFPHEDRGSDQFRGPSPVLRFPPNRVGLHDMAGNLWCWCADWYDQQYYVHSPTTNPSGPHRGTDRVLRGGCWLTSDNCPDQQQIGYRDHTRAAQTTNHTGFRCARDDRPG